MIAVSQGTAPLVRRPPLASSDRQPGTCQVGYASAPCGISVLSSYASGVGAVLPVDLPVRVVVRLVEGERPPSVHRVSGGGDRGGRLLGCLPQMLDELGIGNAWQARLRVVSPAPPGVGLKTSTAVLAASILAMGQTAACPKPVGGADQALVAMITRLALRHGLSTAGGGDDAWACVSGEVVVAAAMEGAVLRRISPPPGVEILIRVPVVTSAPVHAMDRRRLMASHGQSFRLLVSRLVRTGDIETAMTKAALLQARAFGYDPSPLRQALSLGARAVTLSGKGPAVAALVDRGCGQAIEAAWTDSDHRVARVGVAAEGAAGFGGRTV